MAAAVLAVACGLGSSPSAPGDVGAKAGGRDLSSRPHV